MNILNINDYSDDVIRMNDDVVRIVSEVVHEAVEIVGKEYFVLAFCVKEEAKLAA